jgi:phage baseplate assembly protein W
MSTDFLGKGLRFPFAFQRRSGGAQVSTVTSLDHAHIHESILQILGTRPGERFMNPEFGSRIKDLVFEPNDFVLKGLIRRYVIDAIERWEKRVYVTDVSFDDTPETVDANTIPVRISYRVIDTQVEGNLVWPFCREELVESSDTDTRRAAIG